MIVPNAHFDLLARLQSPALRPNVHLAASRIARFVPGTQNVECLDTTPFPFTVLITGGEIGTKNHEARTIPLFGPLARLIDSMRARKRVNTEDSFIFEIVNARLQVMRACERLGLSRFGHHTMRHFFCSNAIEAGCDFKVIAEWLGHKDGGVLVAMTYGHLRSEHSAAMAKRLTFDATKTEQPENVVALNPK
jgi:integrase